MRSTPSLWFSLANKSTRLILLALVSIVGVAALLSFAVSANKANRAANARAEQTANAKSAINPLLQDKQPNAPAAAVIVATLTDNTAAGTKVAPGGVINYTATITNNGAGSPADDATNLNFSAPLDANTTLVNGSVHASPLAFNDTYNWVGNTQLDTVARVLPAVTANDIAVNAPGGTDTFTVTAIGGGATALGGVVTLASPAGSFVYTPPLGRPNIADGATVQDSFTYTITNSADPTLTATGTVRINLTGRVWYLVAGGVGDGRSNTPSSSPAAMSTAADKSTDIFYIFSNAGSLNGPFSVDASQQLLGQGVSLVVSAITLFNAAAPTPTTTNTAGSCVSLAGAPGNNTLSGFNIGNCTGATAIAGSNVGTLNINTMSINTNGGGLDLTGVGLPTVSVVLGGLTSTGGTKNVNLVGLNGTVTLASGALSGSTSGATNHAFAVSGGGTATITYSGSITKANTGNVVNISGRTGGTITLSGAINGSSSNGINASSNTGGTIDFSNGTKTLNTGANAGVTLGTNTGATINFSNGGLNIDTTSGSGFSATGGGTVNVTGSANTIDSTTGTALNVANTTIGASGLTFQSISSNGAANGIVLNSTGATAGLTVTGTGGTCTNANTSGCSGGTIQNSTGADNSGATPIGTGIVLNGTTNPSFTRMFLHDQNNYGIRGTSVTGFTLDNSVLNGVNGTDAAVSAGSPFNEGTIKIDNLSGSATISNTFISGGISNNVRIDNTTATVNRVTFTNDTIGANSTNNGEDGILLESENTGRVLATVQNTTFTSARGDLFNFVDNAASGSADDLIFNNNTLSNNHSAIATGGGGTTISSNGTKDFTFHMEGNSFRDAVGIGILLVKSTGAASYSGTFTNNTIGVAAVANSGSAEGDGIKIQNAGLGTVTVAITNNHIHQFNNFGIEMLTGGGASALSGAFNATITGNTIDTPGNTAGTLGIAKNAIHLNGGTVPGDTYAICAQIGGVGALANNVFNGGADAVPPVGGGQDVRLRQRQSTTVRLPGYGGAATDTTAVQNFIIANNSAGGVPTAIASVNSPPGGGFVGGAACTAPLTIPSPSAEGVSNRMDKSPSSYVSTNMMAQAKTASVKAPVAVTPVVQLSSKDSIASVLEKATPKASAAEVARIYRSERPLSHHAVRKNAFSQEPNAPSAGENVTLNTIATFPAAGKSITIKYSATVNTNALTARQASTQGTVIANGGAINLTTDDPDVGGTQATITLLDTTLTWIGTGTTPTNWNDPTNWTRPGPVVSSYAPGVSNPAVNDVVIPNVGGQPTIGTTDIGIYSLILSNGRTLTITNPRTLTIGGSPGGDLTLNGIISGGFLNLGTGTHAITNAGGTGNLSATNVMTVLSGSTTTLSNNLQAGAVVVNAGGSLNITNQTLSLNGAGAALAAVGTFTTTGSTAVFNGSAAQTTGTVYNNLTINNAAGVTLTSSSTVNGTLALTSGDLNTGAFSLTQPNTTASTGTGDVVGTVIRSGGPFPLGPLTFGNPNNIITFTGAGTRPTTMTVVMTKAAPASYTAAVQRNYTISQTVGSGFTATVRLHYLDSELNGNTPEASLGLRRLRTADNHWVAAPPPPGVPTRDGAANWIEATGVLAADLTTQWTFSTLAPTASGGSITGRIVDESGNAVEGAVVRLSGTQNRKFITDANGFYRFDNVETSGFYTVTPSRVNYTFSPSTRSFNQLGESTEATFGATVATSNLQNPLDTPEYFVRQHYIDFLNREPDETGFNFWSDQILACGGDAECIDHRREHVSAAYFFSIEFQQTGGFVDGLYRTAYGVRPSFASFMPDARTVGLGVQVGKEGWQTLLEANKSAFVNAFVSRPDFLAVYGNMDDSLFVDTLIGHTGVAFTAAERDALLSGLGAGSMTRAEALRSIAENSRFVSAKFNDTFVLTEYFGYLRRDPDAGGFQFWLDKLNHFNGNFEQAEMVRAFIVSTEYRDRFPR